MKHFLGTMTIGGQLSDAADVQQLLEDYRRECVAAEMRPVIDTAHLYQEGRCEILVGNVIATWPRDSYEVHSKVHPWELSDFTKWAPHGLSPERMKQQLDEILTRLRLDFVDVLYLHAPEGDLKHLGSTLEQMGKFLEEKKVLTWGISNFPAWVVVHICHMCDTAKMPRPTIYQGMYNPLTRNVEVELLPCLRHLGIPFVAYNILAGGLLSGKYENAGEVAPDWGRFKHFPAYRNRYWKTEYRTAVEILASAARAHEMSLLDATVRFMKYHSALTEKEDAVLLGASALDQRRQMSKLLSQKTDPLPDVLVNAFEDAWRTLESKSPKYFRP